MHSAVLQNDKYIKFAAQNSIEVLVVSSLERGIQAKDKKAATFNRRGSDEEFLVSWPNLTVNDIQELRKTKAGRYNDTGRIPYMCLVDPHTEERINVSKARSAKALMEEVTAAQKILSQKYGKGMDRRVFARFQKGKDAAVALGAKGDYSKAVKALDKGAKGRDKWPEALQARYQAALDEIMAGAEKEFEAAVQLDGRAMKRALLKLRNKVRGTPIAERVEDALKGA